MVKLKLGEIKTWKGRADWEDETAEDEGREAKGEQRGRGRGQRTEDKGHIKTGIYILDTRGSRDDKKQGKSKVVMAGRRENDKAQERPAETNGRTGSKTDWQANKSCTSETCGGIKGGRGKKDECGGGRCSQRRCYVPYKSGTVSPSFFSPVPPSIHCFCSWLPWIPVPVFIWALFIQVSAGVSLETKLQLHAAHFKVNAGKKLILSSDSLLLFSFSLSYHLVLSSRNKRLM